MTAGTKLQTKYSKLECLKFDGENFRGWPLKTEQFLMADQTSENDKACIVMMHLEGKALQWHQRYMKNQNGLSEVIWTQYLHEMHNMFDNSEFTGPR